VVLARASFATLEVVLEIGVVAAGPDDRVDGPLRERRPAEPRVHDYPGCVQDPPGTGPERVRNPRPGVAFDVADGLTAPRSFPCRLDRFPSGANGEAAGLSFERLGEAVHGRQRPERFHDAGDNTPVSRPPLTSLSHGAGCGCKLPAATLHGMLAELPAAADGPVLVGSETADDAAVYQLSDELAVITTADFFTPIVDDPYDFGRVAAANALSDVYAMGGTPITALNLVAWPLADLGEDALREVLRGGAAVAAEAGVAVVGGHSIDDPEPKYGMAVTGVVDPREIVRNSTGRPGDRLFLTKPVGGGVAATATKRGLASPELSKAAVDVMTMLNRAAAAAARDAGATAATDVTGFGLLGHLHELAGASGLSAEVTAADVPALPEVLELLAGEEPPIAGGTRRNREWVEGAVEWADEVSEAHRWLLCDAMTSGGLLIAAPAGSKAPGAEIGRLEEGEPGAIRVR
jgi:selenide,water dikinase